MDEAFRELNRHIVLRPIIVWTIIIIESFCSQGLNED